MLSANGEESHHKDSNIDYWGDMQICNCVQVLVNSRKNLIEPVLCPVQLYFYTSNH